MLLETPRLHLRRFREQDAPALAAYRSDPAVARYQGWTAPVSTESAVALAREFAHGDPRRPGWFQYAVELRSRAALVGDLGVRLHDNRMQADLGFTMAGEHQGRGYATEAVRAVLHDLFAHGVHRVSAECDARNTRSARLLERAGFRREGLRRHGTHSKGEWTDDLLFGLLDDQWHPTAP